LKPHLQKFGNNYNKKYYKMEIIDSFYNKFLDYKENYSNDFMKEKIKDFLRNTETKEKVFRYLDFNKTLDKKKFFSENFSKKEKEIFFKLKESFSLEDFSDFLSKLGISSSELEKEYFQSYVGFSAMIFRFGESSNLKIAKNILFLWVLVDNISDNPELKDKKSLLKNVFIFFETKVYESTENMCDFFKKNNNDHIINLFSELFYLLEDCKRVDFFKTAKKLFEFSYTKEALKKEKNSSPKDLLKISMMKTFKSVNIFSFCLEKREKLFSKEEYYLNSLLLQLIDDLIDLGKDLKEGSNTFVTNCTIKERTVLFLVIMTIQLKEKKEMEKYIVSLFLALIENRHLYEEEFIFYIKDITNIDLNEGGYKNTKEFFEGLFKKK